MPALKCSVETCLHNSDHYCCKGKIIVEGSNAKEPSYTCCGSFDERSGESFRNRYESPDETLIVACEAVNCVFNKKKKCEANRISISGENAGDAHETACVSFVMA